MSHRILALIPARMASSRFPGKPLATIHGMPMIGHVYERARASQLLTDVYVATCDESIRNYISASGGRSVMTSDKHERCTDRCVEALQIIEKERGIRFDIILILQGDEPMVTPAMIAAALEPLLSEPEVQVVNLMGKIRNREQHADPNEVKVVVDCRSDAIYFSREPIPSWRKGAQDVPMQRQVCVMPFRRDFLLKYAQLAPTPLEIIESVDMLRIIEHGYKVRMVRTEVESFAVDTPADLAVVERQMENDRLRKAYQSVIRVANGVPA